MNDLINKWLSGKRNYTIGCVLYDKYGVDDELKKLFAKGKSPYTEKRLAEELERLVSAIEQPESSIKNSPFTIHHSPEAFPKTTDKTLTALRDQWMPLYTEMNYKRHELDRFLNQKTDSATRRRGKLAMEILSLEKQCMAIWATRNHYQEFGRLPAAEKPDPVLDPAKQVSRYKNVQGYIRRYKSYLAKDPTNARNIELLKQYEQEFETLKKAVH